MKNVISILFLSFTIAGNAQTFGELGDEWFNSYTHHVGPGGPGQGTSHHMEATMFRYVNDTTVGLDTFQIITKCQKRWGHGYNGFPAEYEHDSLYVYQDSMQVFYGTPGDMKLIYDFNLQVGDSTLIYTGWNASHSQYVHVIQTDSVEVDGTWRKRIIFDDINMWHEGMRWIEGVGDELYGVFRDPIGNYFDLHYNFFMKHENIVQIGTGVVVYTCYEALLSTQPQENVQLIIYPNPISDFATISYSGNALNYVLEVYDVRGNLVLQQMAESQNSLVDMSTLKNGLYLLQVNDGQGIYTSKIIKQ